MQTSQVSQTPQTSGPQHTPNIRILVFGHASLTTGQTLLAEQLVSAGELVDGRFEAQLDARIREKGWWVTHLCRRTPEDAREYEDLLKIAAEFGMTKAARPARALLERFLAGEVTEGLLFALGRAVREGGGHPIAEYALKAAERDVYRVFWRVRLGPAGVHAVLGEAESWAEMTLDWTRP
jgi:hypothetical protein